MNDCFSFFCFFSHLTYGINLPTISLLSWIGNWILLILKLIVGILSKSKSIYASLTDSAMDIFTQFILMIGIQCIQQYHHDYPIGRSRIETITVLFVSILMIIGSEEVIQYSCVELVRGFHGNKPKLEINMIVYSILGSVILIKSFLYLFCRKVYQSQPSDTLKTMTQDHFNDILSNSVIIATISIAHKIPSIWWIDPVAAITISVIVIFRWFVLIADQIRKFIGYRASPEFVEKITQLGYDHESAIVSIDSIRSYYCGTRYIVEMDIVLPPAMTVKESHDIAITLQQRLEELNEVERAFVHVDYMSRVIFEHKTERDLSGQVQIQGIKEETRNDGNEEIKENLGQMPQITYNYLSCPLLANCSPSSQTGKIMIL